MSLGMLVTPAGDAGGGGVFATATAYFDYVNNIATGPGITTIAGSNAITRASTGYAEDTAGVWTSFGNNVLRRTNKGLLVEESRTNSIRNNSMQGAAAGTPGTRPTNWTPATALGLTANIIGTGTQNGIDYIDIQYVGTTSGAGALPIYFEATTGAAYTPGDVVTGSAFVALVAGSLSNVSIIRLIHNWRQAAGADLSTSSGTDFKSSLTSTMQRFSLTATAPASTQFDLPGVTIVVTGAVVVDITLRIGWPQLELGSFATSPIRTTSAAATRAADVVTLNNPDTILALSQGTMFAEVNESLIIASGATRNVVAGRVDSNNYNRINFGSTGFITGQTVVGGASQASLVAGSGGVLGSTYKAAYAYAANDFRGRFTPALGANPADDTSGTVPSGTQQIWVGNFNNNNQLNGYIRRLAFFSTPLTNAQLEALVA